MRFKDSLTTALRSLTANKLRSALTMLGIIIGVAAVIGLMSIGRGVEASITSTLEGLGSNAIYVIPQTPGSTGFGGLTGSVPTLSVDDAEALADPSRVRAVVDVAPVGSSYADVIAGSESVTTTITGTNPAYMGAMGYSMAAGQFISERNVRHRDLVAVLGDKTAQDLFGGADPVGEKIKISGRRFTVVGVLEAKGGAMMGISQDEMVLVPITTFHARLFTQLTSSGEDAVQSIVVEVTSAGAVNGAILDIEDVLRDRHHLAADDDDDFAVISQEQILSSVQQITGMLTLLLGAIAGISLLVGGIGIMNIMLVSVTERTREIGIRKAVGAKRRDILSQFLLESAVISLVGSAVGVAAGMIMARLFSRLSIGGGTMTTVVSPDIIVLAISVAIFIGLVSGIYPALRAARLNPIDALHYG
ncbi:MAG: ABC transporter permease [Dehalococcoidales bacterium]|nr:ABC transporter permease [Dehalococcoidales bacterium]